jgi:hypothetical protein
MFEFAKFPKSFIYPILLSLKAISLFENVSFVERLYENTPKIDRLLWNF